MECVHVFSAAECVLTYLVLFLFHSVVSCVCSYERSV
jgi:hypothetical protein